MMYKYPPMPYLSYGLVDVWAKTYKFICSLVWKWFDIDVCNLTLVLLNVKVFLGSEKILLEFVQALINRDAMSFNDAFFSYRHTGIKCNIHVIFTNAYLPAGKQTPLTNFLWKIYISSKGMAFKIKWLSYEFDCMDTSHSFHYITDIMTAGLMELSKRNYHTSAHYISTDKPLKPFSFDFISRQMQDRRFGWIWIHISLRYFVMVRQR